MHEELARWWSEGRAEGRGPGLRAWPLDRVASAEPDGQPPEPARPPTAGTDVKEDACID